MHNFAEVKAVAIRAERDMEKNRLESVDWERKAMTLLQQGESGKLENEKADRLASEALVRKADSEKNFQLAKSSNDKQNQAVTQMQGNIDTLKTKIQQYENELVTLKARAKTAAATSKINKQLSSIDSSGTIAMLERMKEKVEEEETLAIAYGDMADVSKGVEDEIDEALLEEPAESVKSQSDQLAALKQKMGIQQ